MDYFRKVEELLEECLSEKAFKLWSGINQILPNVWNRLTASTKKYHKKMDGRVPNLDEHIYEMLYAAKKVIRMFGYELKTADADVIFLAIALHDTLKYGKWGSRKFCDMKHDRAAADVIRDNKDIFLKLFTEEQYDSLEEAVRFHSGRWSTDVPDIETFDFKELGPAAFFVHTLDMMSTQDLIQTDVRETYASSNETRTGVTTLVTETNS